MGYLWKEGSVLRYQNFGRIFTFYQLGAVQLCSALLLAKFSLLKIPSKIETSTISLNAYFLVKGMKHDIFALRKKI